MKLRVIFPFFHPEIYMCVYNIVCGGLKQIAVPARERTKSQGGGGSLIAAAQTEHNRSNTRATLDASVCVCVEKKILDWRAKYLLITRFGKFAPVITTSSLNALFSNCVERGASVVSASCHRTGSLSISPVINQSHLLSPPPPHSPSSRDSRASDTPNLHTCTLASY